MEPRDAMDRRERALALGLGVGFVAAVLLTLASPFLMAVAADEAWLLLGIRGLVDSGAYAHAAGPGSTTTGGIYALAQVLLYLAGGDAIWLPRMFPAACFLLLLAEIFRWARREGVSPAAALLAPCVLMALPGTVHLATSAYGALPAMLLLFWGVRLWCTEGPRTRGRTVAAGAVFGLAAATRINFALALPALALSWLLRRPRRGAGAGDLALACAVGAAVLLAGHTALASFVPAGLGAFGVAEASGLGGLESALPRVIKKWVVASGFLPFPLLVLASAAAPWIGRRGGALGEALRMLLSFAWLSWLAWLAVAPIPHLRYLWPSLACFAIVLGLGLSFLCEWARAARRAGVAAAALCVGIACLAAGSATTLRNLMIGETNVLVWEWREAIAVQPTPLAFDRAGDQRAMADVLRRSPQARRIGVLGIGLELELLSGRNLPTLQTFAPVWHSDRMPTHILTTPHLGRLIHLDPEAYAWLRTSCLPLVSIGEYRLCRVVGEYPAEPAIFRQQLWRPRL